MNIIAGARLHKKELHSIYTDIKGAFSSVPYQAFTDALTCLGSDGSFLDLIHDIQRNFYMVAKGQSSGYAKNNGVHEGNCLSPTLFCLVLNMCFTWLRARNVGYEMESAKESPLDASIKIPVNSYAGDMALLGKSRQEVT
jgi:hypothetical protein